MEEKAVTELKMEIMVAANNEARANIQSALTLLNSQTGIVKLNDDVLTEISNTLVANLKILQTSDNKKE